MSKSRTNRFYYRNGRIQAEIRELDGKLHGLSRTWHFNGRLAEVLSYYNGVMHGVSRQWDEDGHLLGAFEMVHGTGTQRYWHDNGRLKTEIDSLAGRFHGRTRVWLRDGTLIQEAFYVQNRAVSRGEYLKNAHQNPDWPQYKGEPPGHPARETPMLERKQFKLFVESILEHSHAEARRWLAVKNAPDHSLARFRNQKAALHFVEELYATGALKVEVAPVYRGRRGRLLADWLLTEMPRRLPVRRALRRICRDFCQKRGGAVLPDKDIGENHLFLRLV